LLENVLLELNQNGKVLRRYVLGSEIDKRFWMEVFDDNENREIKTIYYHTDHSGSVVLLSDEKGGKSGEYEYSPYGMILVAFGPQAKKNFYIFAGTRYLVNLGMYWMRMRMYDPRTGRFIQVDPFGRKSFGEDFTFLISEEFNFGMRKEGCGSCCGRGRNPSIATNSVSKYEPYYNYYLYAGGNPIRLVLSYIYNYLTEAINNPNKPKLRCKRLSGGVAEYFPAIGISIDTKYLENSRTFNTTCDKWDVALTLLHEVVHWAWRGDDRAYSCECRCWEKNAKSCDWIGNSLGCPGCKTPPSIGNYNTCLDCC
jgi:RHS repeat-associated protein